ncbi:MAG: hypothetical protein JNL01_01360 [Bdellovibrionales bacterium]|nr:hypothetical protein [Bdellovibrionales bacterium]
MSRGLWGLNRHLLQAAALPVVFGLSACSARLDWNHFLNGIATPSSITLLTPAISPGNNPTPTVRVHGTAPTDTVELFSDATCSTLVSSAVATGNQQDFTVPAVTEGPTYTYWYKKTDIALVSAGCSTDSVSYVYDATPPSISISAPSAAQVGSSGTVTFTVTYSGENSISLSAPDVIVNTTGGASCTATVSGSGSTRTVTLSSCTGNGTAGISIGAGTAMDAAGNIALASGASPTTTVDTTPPTIAISAPSGSLINSAGSVTYTVSYTGQSTSSLVSANVTQNTTGGASCSQSVTGSGASYTVTLSSCTGDGTVGISVAAGTAADAAGNLAAAAGPSSTFTVDNLGPTIAISAPSGSLTNSAGSITYAVGYTGHSSTSLVPANVTVNGSGATCSHGVTGSGASYTVTLSGCTGDGTVGISIAAGTATDGAGNLAAAAGPSSSFTVDNTGPGISISAPSASLTNVTTPVTYTVTYSGFTTTNLLSANVTVNTTGTVACSKSVSGSGSSYTVSLINCTGDGTAGISIAAGTATDAAGNTAASSGPSSTFTVDNLGPTIAISMPSGNLTNSSTPITYTVTYTGENAISLASGDVTLNTTGGATCSKAVTGTGSTRTVTLSSCSGNGTVGISIAAGTASDTIGNLSVAAGPSSNFTVDTAAPAAPSSLALQNPNYTPANDDTPTIRVSGVSLNDTVELHEDSACTSLRGSITSAGTTADVTSSTISTGAHTFYARAIDSAGNTGPCSSASISFTHDPSTLGIVSLTVTNASPTNTTAYGLNWGTITGAYTHYCINVNDSNIGACAWQAGSVPASVVVPGGDGPKTLYAWIRDTVPNYSPMVTSNTVNLDMTAPAAPSGVYMVAPLSNPGTVSTPQFQIDGTAVGDFVQLYSDTGCTSLRASGTAAGTSITLTSSALPEGFFNFTARRTDPAGNTGPCSFTVSVFYTYQYDITPPTLGSFSVTIPGPTNNSNYPINFGSPAGDYTQYCINENDTDPMNCIWYPTPLPTTKGVNPGVQGGKVLSAWLRDDAGNISPVRRDSASVVFDNIIPTLSWSALPTVAGLASPVSLSWTASGTGSGLNASATIQFSSDGTTFGGSQVFDPNSGTASYTALAMPDGNFPLAKFRMTLSDLAGNSTSVDLPTRVLAVAPQFASAPHWNSYYVTATPSNPCVGTEVGRNACRHGGDRRAILAGDAVNCTGITADDSLGAFDWTCTMISGYPYVVSRLKAGKNLFDLITTGPTRLAQNAVTVRLSGTPIYTSIPRTWWANTIKDETLGTGLRTLTPSGGDVNPIWVVTSSGTSDGYNLNGDGIGLVILPPAKFTFSLTGAANVNTANGEPGSSNWAMVSAGSQKFIWIEGVFDGQSFTNAPIALYLYNVRYSKVRGPSIVNAGSSPAAYAGVELMGASKNVEIANIRIAHTAYGLSFDSDSSFNTVRNVTINNTVDSGIVQYGATAPTGNVFQNIVLSHNEMTAIRNNAAQQNIFSQITVAANTGGSATYASIDETSSSTKNVLHNFALVGNGQTTDTYGMLALWGADNTYSQFAISHNPIFIDEFSSSTSNRLTGLFLLGLKHSGVNGCYSASLSSIPNGTCANAGESTATWVNVGTPANVATAFFGKVTANDTLNASDTLGAAAYTSGMDMTLFDNFYRSWGFDGLNFWTTSNQRKACTSLACRIYDWSAAAADATLRNRSHSGSTPNPAFTATSACPSILDGNTGPNILYTDNQNGSRPYLKNAVELVGLGFGTGNEDGLCESGETCLYTPNFGAYQGHGTADSCLYTGSTITGVNMIGYSTNGR